MTVVEIGQVIKSLSVAEGIISDRIQLWNELLVEFRKQSPIDNQLANDLVTSWQIDLKSSSTWNNIQLTQENISL